MKIWAGRQRFSHAYVVCSDLHAAHAPWPRFCVLAIVLTRHYPVRNLPLPCLLYPNLIQEVVTYSGHLFPAYVLSVHLRDYLNDDQKQSRHKSASTQQRIIEWVLPRVFPPLTTDITTAPCAARPFYTWTTTVNHIESSIRS